MPEPNTEHPDFEPDDSQLGTEPKRFREKKPEDPRTMDEAIDDLIDPRITNLLHGFNALTSEDDEYYGPQELRRAAIEAYFLGARETVEHPEVFDSILKAATTTPVSSPGIKILESHRED